jgi:hypothetical protein
MANNVLDPSALVGLLINLLPPTSKILTSPHDGLAALVHTAFSALSFRLIATDDTSSAKEHPNNVLPDDWNTKGLVDRTFRYRHDQSGLEFVVKVIKLGQRTLISAIAVEVRQLLWIQTVIIQNFRVTSLRLWMLRQTTLSRRRFTPMTQPSRMPPRWSTASFRPTVSRISYLSSSSK